MNDYPQVFDREKVGAYPGLVFTGGGYVWDEVLEYRIWCYPMDGAEDLEDGDDYYYAFADAQSAIKFHEQHSGTSTPIALVLQQEHINEPQPGNFVHVTEERMTEWPVEFLSRPKRTKTTIPAFLAHNAPENRLDIIRGQA